MFRNLICTIGASLLLTACSVEVPNAPEGLTVGDGISAPVGYGDPEPRFSWKLEDERFGAAQTAYQIIVRDADDGRVIWDSGKVDSEQSLYVEYGGAPFASRDRLSWRVRYWDQNEEVSPWSESAGVEYGLLSNSDWQGKWIHQAKVRDLSGIEVTKAVYGRAPRFSKDITEGVLAAIEDDPNRIFEMRVGEGELFEREKRTGSPMALALHYTEDGQEKSCLSWDGQLIVIPPTDLCSVPYFRKEFELGSESERARLYVTARGIFEVEINGRKVGNDAFTPGWTDYFQRIETLTYDVSEYLVEGPNVIGARIAKGWYAGEVGYGIGKKGPSDVNRGLGGQIPEFLCQLEVEEKSGAKKVVVSDETWKVHEKGPFLKSEIYWGEDYDADRELPGWSSPGFNADGFKDVGVTALDGVILEPKSFQTVSVRKTLSPITLQVLNTGEAVFDMGQNMVGWPVVRIPVKKGKKVTLRVAEMLEKDGTLYTENYRNSRSQATYLPAADGIVEWRPTFTFFGYRYLEISGYDPDYAPEQGWAKGEVLHSGFEKTGDFESSHEKLNQLQSNIQWGQRGNFLDIPTDCPQRNERLGWTGDAQVFAATSLFNFNTHAFWKSWLKTLREHQAEDGRLPVVAPNVGTFANGPVLSPGWGDAIAIVPWEIYLQIGDVSVLEENFEAMKRYAELYLRRSKDFIGPNVGFGDWLQPILLEWQVNPDNSNFGSTPRPLIASCFFGYTAMICAKSARILGADADAERYEEIVDSIREAVSRHFLDEEGRLKTPVETQTGYTLLLAFDLVDAELKPRLASHLAELVRNDNGRLNSGFLGTSYLPRVLDAAGYTEESLGLLFTDEYPSWFYSIDQGATTIWERWNSYSHKDGFGDANMNSFNHYAYGAIGRWMYERLAGLAPDESDPGYRRFVVNPLFDSPLDQASAALETRYGKAETRWRKLQEGISLDVIVPPNTTATIRLSKEKAERVSWENAPSGGKIEFENRNGEMHTTIVAGRYQFLIRN
ncbi:alpha-L-rhamnosidase [Pelagicoccus mobilis]|uniref:alpha-L-rhamnosidase n=1 Tax=Pelagicoccus mobilis TaxID=415221 RepID=A0A934S666_9BACT|nr:alpha-L-rhamnosidase [Pelagicoccus mobilis]MBK1880482.1 family 78 glycoside hydrolase catalytic domain [Pelagicoccus mobilis]